MSLSDHVNTLGQSLLRRYGKRVHKLALNAGFTCPNRDGSKGRGGCTFCNNSSFSPAGHTEVPISTQIDAGRRVVARRTRANSYLAYFQAYTNTYAEIAELKKLYERALAEEDVIGLSVGTRPDCVPDAVLDLLADYQDQGYEVWLELGLQSSFDETLARVNRGHGYEEYRQSVRAARERGLKVCTHLIVGLPGEDGAHSLTTLQRVVADGVDGLKLHPLHVVKGTALANELRRGEYLPWTMEQYIGTACDMIAHTPAEIIYHRVTATAQGDLLMAPDWCAYKWRVLNGIEQELVRRGQPQGSLTGKA